MQAPWLSLQPCLEMSVTLVRSACPTIQRRQTGDWASGRLPSTAALRGKNLQQTFQLPPFNQDTHCLLEVGPEHWWDNSAFNASIVACADLLKGAERPNNSRYNGYSDHGVN